MKIILSLITALALSGCMATLEMPTRYGTVRAATDGKSVLFGFQK